MSLLNYFSSSVVAQRIKAHPLVCPQCHFLLVFHLSRVSDECICGKGHYSQQLQCRPQLVAGSTIDTLLKNIWCSRIQLSISKQSLKIVAIFRTLPAGVFLHEQILHKNA